ncbi:hypothetical protein [Legionella cincinnatiensis]|uniref:Uncharacterized protein n=1 Tax=Legionella cincinnatiensis TaxID=28085 RepID=A0A378IKM5_9GAMM|nr:hypothetical protein [Legionella cincinnatiensis]KTC78734.1 hypothetical protein Lcin_3349 [Legionella cincinnatiensis]STX35322.1 Uncharacterised protein [Legionella cincinnatiensis]
MSYSNLETVRSTNLTTLNVWLCNDGDFNTDIQKAEKYLQNMGNFILSSVDFTPLEFAEKMEVKLKRILGQADNTIQEEKLNDCINKIENYKKFLKLNLAAAEKKANNLIKQYENVTDIKEECLNEMLRAKPKLHRARNLFIKVAQQADKSIFQRGINSYQILWDQLSTNLKIFKDIVKKYPENQLALLLHDHQSFIEALEDGKIPLGGELGALALQRIFSEYPQLTVRQKVSIATLIEKTQIERDTHCNSVALKSEIIKLQLYAQYCRDNDLPLVAWIGSARPVFSMIADHPGEGAYLNCDDAKWSPELNSTWLLIVSSMGYEIKLVEQHYPKVVDALTSGKILNYVSALIDEIRPFPKEFDSQYHGGDQPTATPQEILRLMSIGCKAKKNDDGSVSLTPPKSWVAEDYRSRKIKGLPQKHNIGRESQDVGVSRTRRHSVSFFKGSAQPVKKSLFEHPGESEEIRKNEKPKL